MSPLESVQQDLGRRGFVFVSGHDMRRMHDFGEYTPRDAVFFDGRRGDEMHDEYPVLSAKAAHDLLVAQKPNDFLFFVRSGYSGTQGLVPAVWGGDSEATFDTTQGIPSTIRAGVNLSMSGVPYWGSDGTGFKCLTSFPHDKEMFLRWVEIMAASPIMMEDNACSNPIQGAQPKWTMWSDAETTATYARWARLHTRLAPYFWALAERAHASGAPITMHPFLLFPDAPEARSIEDAYFLGPALYVWPVVARGAVEKDGWLPPGRYVDLNDFRVYDGDADVAIPAPLDVLPILLVQDQIVPMLDASIDTLAPATDPAVVTPDRVADRLDVQVALSPGGHAHFTMTDGTTLDAERLPADAGNPAALVRVAQRQLADCASCWLEDAPGDVSRLRVNTPLAVGSDVTLEDVHVVVQGGPARRVRWDVLRLKP